MIEKIVIDVSGDYACFTCPELKVERVSYDVITPSSARAIFDAIFWKPEITWHISRIEVLNPINKIRIMRNEVSAVASPKSNGICIEDHRDQKHAYILKDVRYRLHGWFSMNTDGLSPRKYSEMFKRRVSKGQYFHTPYFGCREFACRDIRLVDMKNQATEPSPIHETRDLGFMVYDKDYKNGASTMLYHALMYNGVIEVPDQDSLEVLR